MNPTGHWQTFYDKARAAGADDTKARGIADHAQTTFGRCMESHTIGLVSFLSDRLTEALSHD